MTIICKKGVQDFNRALSKVFDGVKSVALWSANIRKNCPRTIRAMVPQLHYGLSVLSLNYAKNRYLL
jgi:hypothetical protein